MNSLENLYLMFRAWEVYFLLPLETVEKVQDRLEAQEDLPCLDFYEILGEKGSENQKGIVCVSVKGKIYGIFTDEVRGIREVEETQMMPLEEPVVNEKNTYLKAAVPLMEEREILAFAVDAAILGEKVFEKILDGDTGGL